MKKTLFYRKVLLDMSGQIFVSLYSRKGFNLMKTFIFLSILTYQALAGRAQQTQQTDSVSLVPVWSRANSPSKANVFLDYLSHDTCWAVTSDSTGLIQSTDGGRNWHWIPSPPAKGASFYNAHFGYSFGSSYTYRTTNAGITWDSAGTPPPDRITSPIVLSDSVHIFFSSQPYLDHSTDGGKTWDRQIVGYGEYIGFANLQVGYDAGPDLSWPGGRNGMFLSRTTNGGNSWDTIYNGVFGDAEGIAVIDPNTIEVITDYGTIWRSANGGKYGTWQQITLPGPAVFTSSGIVIKNGIGYATAAYPAQPSILHTSDTGKTWTMEPSNSNNDLYTPVMYGDTLAAVAGDSGIILIRNIQLAGIGSPPIDSLAVSIFPNPAQSIVTLSYSLPVAQNVTLTILDVNGNVIATPLSTAPQPMGSQSVPISTANFASGIYYFRFSSQNYSSTGSFIVTQ